MVIVGNDMILELECKIINHLIYFTVSFVQFSHFSIILLHFLNLFRIEIGLHDKKHTKVMTFEQYFYLSLI